MGELPSGRRRPTETNPANDQFGEDTRWMSGKLDQLADGQLRDGSTRLSSFLIDPSHLDPDRPRTIEEHLSPSVIDIFDRTINLSDFPVIQEIVRLREELERQVRYGKKVEEIITAPSPRTPLTIRGILSSYKDMVLSVIPGTKQYKSLK